MSAKKSTIVRNAQAASLRTTFGALERTAPALGARLAERLWFSVGKPPSRAERDRRAGLAEAGTAFTADAAGAQVRGRVFGEADAPVAILVHGWGGWWQQLSAFVPALLERGHRVVAFDALAHGDSGPGALGRRSTTVPEMAASYAAVVERFGAPALTVAHSMGCVSVAWAQREHGIVPERQVLVAPAATTDGMVETFATALGIGPTVRAGLVERFVRRVGRPLEDFDLLPLVEAEQAAGRLSPGLVVHDRADAVTSADASARLAEAWSGADLLLTDGLGHRRVLRDPAVVAATGRFLDLTASATHRP
jgi:pimeloyl-ACP methyl ester carboxylesterase